MSFARMVATVDPTRRPLLAQAGWRRLLLAGTTVALLFAVVSSASATSSYQAFTAPFTPNWQMSSVAVDGSGAVWAASSSVSSVRRIASGTTTRIDLPFGTTPSGIEALPQGVALSLPGSGGAVSLDATGALTSLGAEPQEADGLARAADGTVWVGGAGKLTRYPPSGSSQDYPVPDAFGSARHVMKIALGGDGSVWFTSGYDVGMSALGRIAPNGSISLVLSEASGEDWPDANAYALAATSDGHAWLRLNDGTTDLVRRVAADGGALDVPGVSGALARSADDQVYVLDSATLSKVDHTGVVTSEALPDADQPKPTSNLAVDSDGGLAWVAASGPSIIRRTSAGVYSSVTPDAGTPDYPSGIAVTPNGSVWITERGSHRIARIDSSGTVQQFSAGLTGVPTVIRADTDGTLWAIESVGKIAHIFADGSVTEMVVPNSSISDLQDLAIDSSGTIWVVDAGNKTIYRMVRGGTLTVLPTGSSAHPIGIALHGTDAWFTESESKTIAHITPAGTVTRFPLSNASGSGSDQPGWIAATSSGDLWVDDRPDSSYVRLSPTGTVLQRLTAPNPGRLALGADGRLWLNPRCYSLSFLDPDGSTVFSTSVPGYGCGGGDGYKDVAVAPNGDIWSTQPDLGAVVRYTPDPLQPADSTPPTVTITRPAEGEHFTLGSTPTPAYDCDDDQLLIDCQAADTIDTSTTGPHQFTVTAIDQAGHETTKTVNYIVDAPQQEVPTTTSDPGTTTPTQTTPTTPPRGPDPTTPTALDTKPLFAPTLKLPTSTLQARTRGALKLAYTISVSGRATLTATRGRTSKILLRSRVRAGRHSLIVRHLSLKPGRYRLTLQIQTATGTAKKQVSLTVRS
jgi:streptogramin lyase